MVLVTVPRLFAVALALLLVAPGASSGASRTIRRSLRAHVNPIFSVASHYGPGFHGRKQANGRPFNEWAMTCAHRTMAFGTKLLVLNPETGRRVVLTVTDRGPFIRGRSLDVSTRAAELLGFKKKGVTTLVLRPLAWGRKGIEQSWAH